MLHLAESVELREYEVSEPLSIDDNLLAALQTIPADRLGVQPADRVGLYRLRAGSWIGAVVLPGLTIRIRPKVVDLRNVLMMFGAGTSLASWSEDQVDYASAELVDGVADLVLRLIDAATRRGLVRGYTAREERLPTIRGRLLVEQIARRPWDLAPAPCSFDDYTGDVAENRVLRSVVATILRWPGLDPAVRRRGVALLARFAEVERSANPLLEWQTIVSSRLNEHYADALAVGRLVLEDVGIADAGGSYSAQVFLVDMNSLFEHWVGAEMRRRLWPRIDVLEQERVHLSRRPTVTMKPDLIFRIGNSVCFVGDVKYKLTSSGMSHTDDYYQLLAYVTALGLTSGLLIYCQANDAPEKEIVVLRGRQRLLCRPLSLDPPIGCGVRTARRNRGFDVWAQR